MKNVRVDKKLDAAVNKGLAAALLFDVPTGIKVMTEQGVPSDIMTRVFLAPQQRRDTDWKLADITR
jgi:hypothetical protein